MCGIHGLFDHIAEAQIYFPRQIRNAYPSVKAFSHGHIDTRTEYRRISFPDFNDLSRVIRMTDDAFVSAVDEIDEISFDPPIQAEAFEAIKSGFRLFSSFRRSTISRTIAVNSPGSSMK